jgi:hypothetical protein
VPAVVHRKKAHYDSWYTRGFCSVWQVSNWKEGGINYGTTSDIYGRGEFYVSFNVGVGDLILQDDYVNFYIRCDKNGKYSAHFVKRH